MNFIITLSGAEYAEDFTFFVENQVAVSSSRSGTIIFSLLEQKTFFQTGKRNLAQTFIHNKLKEIHRNILNHKI